MTRLILLLSGFFIVMVTKSYAQPEIPSTFNQQFLQTTLNKLDHIAGSPYLEENFQNGTVFYDRADKMGPIPLRLNLYNDQLEYKGRQGVMAFKNSHRIDSAVIGDQVFVFIPKRPEHNLQGFVKKITPGEPAVVVKMKVQFFKREEKKPYDLEEPKPDRLERIDDIYYLVINEREIRRVNSIKRLTKYLNNHHSQLTKYVKNELVSDNFPDQLIEVMEYYHQLENQQLKTKN